MYKTVVLATIVQFVSIVLCQYPIQFPFAQSLPHMRGHNIAPIPPLPPQSFIPQQMPMHFPIPQKMPSVVMPYYSKSKKYQQKYRTKRRKLKRREEAWKTDDSSESSSHEFDFRRSKRRRQVLTPVVSYITKHGYVVYQKKIKKDKAKDWLQMAKKKENRKLDSFEDRDMRRMYKKSRRE